MLRRAVASIQLALFVIACEPAAPLPPPAGHGDSLYVVLFESGSADLKPAAEKQLRRAVDDARTGGFIHSITAHTDRSGDPESNLKLAQSRLEKVRDYLTTQGIDLGRTYMKSYGAQFAMPPTIAGGRDPHDRRVDIWTARPLR